MSISGSRFYLNGKMSAEVRETLEQMLEVNVIPILLWSHLDVNPTRLCIAYVSCREDPLPSENRINSAASLWCIEIVQYLSILHYVIGTAQSKLVHRFLALFGIASSHLNVESIEKNSINGKKHLNVESVEITFKNFFLLVPFAFIPQYQVSFRLVWNQSLLDTVIKGAKNLLSVPASHSSNMALASVKFN